MSDFFKEMVRFGRYKSSQGKVARQLTMCAVMAIFAIAAWKLYGMPMEGVPFLRETSFRFLTALLVFGAGFWFAYRLVQFPPFADFLVSVEAEMIKVYWPPKSELYSSTIVVLVVFALLAVLIFAFDTCWQVIFRWIGVLPPWR